MFRRNKGRLLVLGKGVLKRLDLDESVVAQFAN